MSCYQEYDIRIIWHFLAQPYVCLIKEGEHYTLKGQIVNQSIFIELDIELALKRVLKWKQYMCHQWLHTKCWSLAFWNDGGGCKLFKTWIPSTMLVLGVHFLNHVRYVGVMWFVFHVLRPLPIRYTQRSLCCISNAMTKHRQKLDPSWFNNGQFKCIFVDSLFE